MSHKTWKWHIQHHHVLYIIFSILWVLFFSISNIALKRIFPKASFLVNTISMLCDNTEISLKTVKSKTEIYYPVKLIIEDEVGHNYQEARVLFFRKIFLPSGVKRWKIKKRYNVTIRWWAGFSSVSCKMALRTIKIRALKVSWARLVLFRISWEPSVVTMWRETFIIMHKYPHFKIQSNMQ